jgi:bacterioferritin
MRGDANVITALNELLAVEFTAVHQYMLHARMCERWGYQRLFKKIHGESREELEHADHLIERILFLEGTPDVARVQGVTAGASVHEQLRADHGLEAGAVAAYNRAIDLSRRAGDNGTAELLENILEDTEEHVDWLESQLTAIDQIGIERYLAEQLKSGSTT